MIIRHNIMAINAQRQSGIVFGRRKKSAEKLSSGYRINRSADDAAGLAISESMRRQIRGLTQAVQNARDGIAFCQTADGALTEVSSMIQRINTLSVQAANSIYSENDRNCIQEEIDQLMREIDRIGQDTEFGGQKVFQNFAEDVAEMSDDEIFNALKKGAFPTVKEDITLEDGQILKADNANIILKCLSSHAMMYEMYNENYTFSNDKAEIKNMVDTMHDYAVSLSENVPDSVTYLNDLDQAKRYIDAAFSLSDLPDTSIAGGPFNSAVSAYQSAKTDAGHNISGTGFQGDISVAGYLTYGLGVIVRGIQYQKSNPSIINSNFPMSMQLFGNASKAALYQSGIQSGELWDSMTQIQGYGSSGSAGKAASIAMYRYIGPQEEGGLWIHCGAESDQGMNIAVDRVDTGVLGLQNLDVTSQKGASESMEAAREALDTLSTIRGKIGASQNRLEHTIDNLNNVLENTTAAESRIRDTDMAEEMVNYVKDNVLMQAGQSMLAQANTVSRNVLALLQ